MGPKKAAPEAKTGNDLEEIRETLNHMSEELTKVTQQLMKLAELFEEVKQLKNIVRERDKTIEEFEKRIDNLEQYTRMEDVIITGLAIKPRSYARAAMGGRNISEDAHTEDLQTLEEQVVNFLAEKDVYLDPNTISVCHTLPRRDKANPAIILRFANRKHKTELMRQGKKLKETTVYLNDHLTRKTAGIAREARILRKNGKIKATWTRNCKVFIQLNGHTPEQAKVILVREVKDLEQFR